MITTDAPLTAFVAQLRGPGEDPSGHLAHTLSWFARCSGDEHVADETFCWGDLRDLHLGAVTEELAAAVRASRRADHEWVVTATVAVHSGRTGLTWGDLRALTGL